MVPYDTAGVMRCCIKSLDHWILTNPIDTREGTIVWCEYEPIGASHWILLKDRWRSRRLKRTGLVWQDDWQ